MRGVAGAAVHAWLALALAGAAALSVGAPAQAQGAQASLSVTAVIPRRTSIRIVQPPRVTVSDRDVARGFVEVDVPVEVVVRSNAAEGYALAFERHGDAFAQVQVLGLAQPLVFAAGGAIANRPAAGRGLWRDEVMLRFRFTLSAGTRAGEHRWPVQISLMNH